MLVTIQACSQAHSKFHVNSRNRPRKCCRLCLHIIQGIELVACIASKVLRLLLENMHSEEITSCEYIKIILNRGR